MEASNSTIEHSDIRINNLRALDKDNFIKLVQDNKVSLYRLSKSILKNEADVEDAISETILKAYKNLGSLKSSSSFKPWIMKILVNECYLTAKNYKRIELTDDLSKYEGTYENDEDNSLMCYVNKLEDEFRAVVILFYYEDLSIKNISRVLNISEGTVKSRLFRAKARLKAMMRID
jgi:RNA polymerase sigma-70 factor (ECF subfamily)